jgi:hypothetical protein
MRKERHSPGTRPISTGRSTVDIDKLTYSRIQAGSAEMANQLLDPPYPLSGKESAELNLNYNAWMLSQFLHGEQGALLATAQIVLDGAAGRAKCYAANQVADEARHVEVYHATSPRSSAAPSGQPASQTLLDQIISRLALGHDVPRHADHGRGLALAAFG